MKRRQSLTIISALVSACSVIGIAHAAPGEGGFAKITPLGHDSNKMTMVFQGYEDIGGNQFFPNGITVRYRLEGAPGKFRSFKRWTVGINDPFNTIQINNSKTHSSSGEKSQTFSVWNPHKNDHPIRKYCNSAIQQAAATANTSVNALREEGWAATVNFPVTYSALMLVNDKLSPFELTRSDEATRNWRLECIYQPTKAPEADKPTPPPRDTRPPRDTSPPRDSRPPRDTGPSRATSPSRDTNAGTITMAPMDALPADSASGLPAGKRQHRPLTELLEASVMDITLAPPPLSGLVPYVGAWDVKQDAPDHLRLRVRHDGDEEGLSSPVIFSLGFASGEQHLIEVNTPTMNPGDVHTFDLPVGFERGDVISAIATVRDNGATYDLIEQELID